MIHTMNISQARELVGAVPNAKIRLWVRELDCYVGITKAELKRVFVGGMALPIWEVDIRDGFMGTVVYINQRQGETGEDIPY